MKTIETGNIVNRKELENLLQFPESVAIVENGQQVGKVSTEQMEHITSDFADFQVNAELDCVENNQSIIKLDFVEYLVNKLGYMLKDDIIAVSEY